MIDCKSCFCQVTNSTGTPASAPYKRVQAYTDGKVQNGLMWLDLIPGIANPSEMVSKQPKSVPDFDWKYGVMSGPSPFFYERSEVMRIKTAAPAGPLVPPSEGRSALSR